MARITLYADKMNQMFGLIEDVKKSVIDYNSELFSLKTSLLSINKSVCNMDDIISSVQASSQTQERKIASLDALSNNVKQFVADVVRIDREVADHIRNSKEKFYSEHENLRPECEKHDWDKFKDGFKASEWCKEHWKLMATTGIVILAVILICTGVGGVLGATMAMGALFGTAIGGTVGGVISTLTGGSLLEGFENGAFAGAIAGIISGGMGFAMSLAGTVALTFGKTVISGAASGVGVSLIGDLGDKFIKKVDISWGQMFVNMAVLGTITAAFAGVGYGISKYFATLKLNGKTGIKLPENATTIQKGNYGEIKMDASFEAKGYERISLDRITNLNSPTHQGLDGVYYSSGPPPSYAIGEAKFGTSTLSKLANGTPQMSDIWIGDRLIDSVGEDLADKILTTGYDRVLVKVDSIGNTTHSLLDALGKTIK